MSAASHNEEATTRDSEVARLYPDSERRHFRATLPARVVLRNIEKNEHEREMKLVGESFVTAAVVGDEVEIYAGSDPVWHAGSLELSRIVAVATGHEFDYTPPRINPTLQLKYRADGDEILDIDLEVFRLTDGELVQSADITSDLEWWQSLAGE